MKNHTPQLVSAAWIRRLCRVGFPVAALLVIIVSLRFAADSHNDRKVLFALPAADAITTLKEYARQADQRLIYSGEAVNGVRTHVVRGYYTARAALGLILEG